MKPVVILVVALIVVVTVVVVMVLVVVTWKDVRFWQPVDYKRIHKVESYGPLTLPHRISVVTIPPHCPALNNCSLRCVHGFMRDNDGCYTCHCQAEECVLECPGGFLQDNHGNKLCKCANSNAGPNDCPPLTGCRKNCSHGYRLKGGCEVCKCKECRPLTDCNKNCVHGLRNNDRGCPICKCRAGQVPPSASSVAAVVRNGSSYSFSRRLRGSVSDKVL
ncbi:hypothetical protein ANN_11942 [Periplaneta americana]|uniref:Antistasin-like domain-containing protein n=1 Tax=Periplaneta americana TaxID=6978 RepID=A0ABQ8T6H0_PERAM|nr:hypothetical protein ANN_11942 [Periplaneta americana]